MLEVKKENFIKEIEKVKEKYNINIEDFKNIYKAYEGQILDININNICDKVINDMFGGYGDPVLPYEFILSDLGKVIISVRYGINNRIYSLNELSDITGFSKQKISYDIKVGNLNVLKKKGFVILYENDINDYLNKKGLGTIAELESKKYKEQEENFIFGEFEREEEYGK